MGLAIALMRPTHTKYGATKDIFDRVFASCQLKELCVKLITVLCSLYLNMIRRPEVGLVGTRSQVKLGKCYIFQPNIHWQCWHVIGM